MYRAYFDGPFTTPFFFKINFPMQSGFGQFAENPPQKVPYLCHFALFFKTFLSADPSKCPKVMIVFSEGN